jgi:hypothetical protein
MSFKIPRTTWTLLLFLLTFSLSASTTNSNERVPPFKITAIRAMLFYEDKGTFSPDVSEVYSGPPYSLFTLWNTPMQYENRSTSVLVTVEVTGDGEITPGRKLEFTARYRPFWRESLEIVVRRVVPIHIAIKVGERDKYNAGFWLYGTGCNPVKLSARVSGSREAPATKRLIKFGCGE